MKRVLFASGILLSVIALLLLALDPVEIVSEPEISFNVEVASGEDGTVFRYIPQQNRSETFYVNYTIFIDGEPSGEVRNRKYAASRQNPITVEIGSNREVSVNMTIRDSEGNRIHQSRHFMSQAPSEASITDFNQLNASCSSSNQSIAEITSVEESNTTYRIEGEFISANPCQTLISNIQKISQEKYALRIQAEQNQGDCVQCIGKITYSATVELPETAELEVYHGTERVSSKVSN